MNIIRRYSKHILSIITGIIAALFGHTSVTQAEPPPDNEVQTIEPITRDTTTTFIQYQPGGTPGGTVEPINLENWRDSLIINTVSPSALYDRVQMPAPNINPTAMYDRVQSPAPGSTTTLSTNNFLYLNTGQAADGGNEAVNSLYILGNTQNIQAFQQWYGTLNRNSPPTALDAAMFRIQTLTTQMNELQQQLNSLQGVGQ